MNAIVTPSYLSVCGAGGQPFGPLRYEDGAATHFQVCQYRGCVDRDAPCHRPDTQLPQPDGQFRNKVELCYCCAAVALQSGFRWSEFFCDICRERVVALNRSYGFAAIPIGRHSMMNAVALSGEQAKRPHAVEEFHAAVTSLWDRIERLECWRRSVVRDQIDAMQGAASPYAPLSAYLVHVNSHGAPQSEMFRQLTRYFGVEVDG